MSHINKKGNPYIIDVSNKDVTERVAVASGEIKFDKETYKKIKSFKTKKGNLEKTAICLLYTSPSPRDATLSRMPSSA